MIVTVKWIVRLTLLLTVARSARVLAADFGAVMNGEWSDPASWTPIGGPPTEADNVYVGTGFPVLALVPASIQLTANEAASLVSVGHGTVALSGHDLSASALLMDSSGGPASVIKSGGHVELELLLLFGGSTFAIEAGDVLAMSASVDGPGSLLNLDSPMNLNQGVAVSDGGVVTTSATLTAHGFGVQITAATFSAGANITASSTFYGVGITNGGVLNLNGHSLTAGVLYLGAGTFQVSGGPATLNRGPGGNVELGSIDVNSGNFFALEAVDSLTDNIRVAGIGSALVLNRDVGLSGFAVVQEHGTLDLNGRLLSASGAVSLSDGGRLTGNGAVLGNVHNNSGIISPGVATGILSVDGTFAQDGDGILMIELAGTENSDPQSSEFDQLIVDGTVSLAGNLVVTLIPSFTPALDDAFPVVTATGGVQILFDSISLPDLPAGLRWEVDDSNSQVLSLRVASQFAGDYNGNGVVDVADYAVWRNTRGQIGSGLAADGSRNGVVGAEDYSLWMQNFGATLGAGSTGSLASSMVPEPGSIAWVAIAIASVIVLRGRSQS